MDNEERTATGTGTLTQSPGGTPGAPYTWWARGEHREPGPAGSAGPAVPGTAVEPYPFAQPPSPPVNPPPAAPASAGPGVPPSRRRRLALGLAALSLAAAATGGGVGALVAGGGSASNGAAVTTSTSSSGSASVAAATSGTIAAAAAKISPSVVTITVSGSGSSDIGSGVILRSDGYILTNNHVIADGGTITVKLSTGTSYPATVVGQSTANDLAVVKVSATGLTPATFANSSAVAAGDLVVAVGSPLGLSNTVTSGVVSAVNRTITTASDNGESSNGLTTDQTASTGTTIHGAIQTDAPINPGNSGGALVNAGGEVIGITSAIETTGSDSGSIGVGFAIPSNTAATVAAQLITART